MTFKWKKKMKKNDVYIDRNEKREKQKEEERAINTLNLFSALYI